MNRTKQQLQRDIQFCRNVLGLTDEQTDQMIMVCDKLKIGAEYFSEEFVFEGDGLESIIRLNDPDYLKITWRLELMTEGNSICHSHILSYVTSYTILTGKFKKSMMQVAI